MAYSCCLEIEREFGYAPLAMDKSFCLVSRLSLIGEIMGIDWDNLRLPPDALPNTKFNHVIVQTTVIYEQIQTHLADLYGIDRSIATQLFEKTAKLATLLRMVCR